MNEASILAEVIKATFANPSLSHELTALLRHVLTVDIGSIKADQQRQEKEIERLRKLIEEQRLSIQKLEQLAYEKDRERAELQDKIATLETRVERDRLQLPTLRVFANAPRGLEGTYNIIDFPDPNPPSTPTYRFVFYIPWRFERVTVYVCISPTAFGFYRIDGGNWNKLKIAMKSSSGPMDWSIESSITTEKQSIDCKFKARGARVILKDTNSKEKERVGFIEVARRL